MEFGEALNRFLQVNTKDLETAIEEKPRPFVKWVGGKRSIINLLKSRMPADFSDYYEPFVGGGALFFSSFRQIKTAVLSDVNIDLLVTYQVVKKDLTELVLLLKKHAEKHNEFYYYKIRAQHSLKDPVQVAARFIYLNKTCFNGLYRVNKKGEFNVPIGRYTDPAIVSEDNLKTCQQALAKATIKMQSYDKIQPKAGAFVYFDPPYHPISKSALFTQYSKNGFTEKNQKIGRAHV